MNKKETNDLLQLLHRELPPEALEHTYVVGGAVRNHLIGQEVKDIDLVVDSQACPYDAKALGQHLVDKHLAAMTTNRYGVALVHLIYNGNTVEIATARKEWYGGDGGKGYKPSAVEACSILEDIMRRDFTVNTLMWRLSDCAEGIPVVSKIIDLTGCGLRDLKQLTLSTPRDAVTTFTDDPTRMLRAVKFSEYFFLSGEITDASWRVAPKLLEIPHNAVTSHLITLLERDLAGSLFQLSLQGLYPTLLRVLEDKAARSHIANWAAGQSLEVQLQLHEVDFPTAWWFAKGVHLTDIATVRRVRRLDPEAQRLWFDVVIQPGRVLDSEDLALRFDLVGAQRSVIQKATARVLSMEPAYVRQREHLTREVCRLLEQGVFPI